MRTRLLPILVFALVLVLVPAGRARGDEKPAAAPAPQPPEAEGLVPKAWLAKMPWRCIGPGNMGGRITSLAVSSKDATTWWAATASGGLLKTTDNGITFTHQFDRERVVSIGDVAVAPSNPDIVWVGTGEGNPRNSVSWGDGAWKSVDGGTTWKHVGLEGTFQISSVRIHPTNPDIVYVGALGRLWGPSPERGLYKTTDGGKTWKKVLFVDEKTGVIDVQMHPGDPETLLVATYERQRGIYDVNPPEKKWGPGSGLYRTTDGGKTFQEVTAGLPTCEIGRIGVDFHRADPDTVFLVMETEKLGTEPENAPYMGITGKDAEVGARLTSVLEKGPAKEAGFQKDDIVVSVNGRTVQSYADFIRAVRQYVAGDRVKFEISRDRKPVFLELTLATRPDRKKPEKGAGPITDPTKMRAPRSPFGAFLGGQRHDMQDQQGKEGHEHGGVFKSTDGGLTWERVNSLNPRPMYFSEIRVDPRDPKKIWVLGIRLWRSVDGGAHFKPDGHPGSVHVDHHALWIDPQNPDHMILGNDGGVYVTYDAGKHYDHLNHVAIGQFYDVGVGPQRDYRVYGGLQDNGSWGGPSRVRHARGPTNEDWIRIGGGDGFRVRVDANDPDQVYFQSQYGGIGRRHLRSGERGMMKPKPPKDSKYRFNWSTPFLLSHHNSRIYYAAGNRVFRSLDRGKGLRAISPDLTATEYGSASALAESPREPDLLYVGTDDGALWTTRNGGHDWIDLRAAEVPAEPEAPEADAKPEEHGDAPATDGNGKGGDRPAAKQGAKKAAAEEKAAAGKPLVDLVPEPRWVAWIEPSRFQTSRVYLVLDGHRSDDDRPLLFASEDRGATWRSIRGNLPDRVGTTRVLREDLVNPDLLYLGTEFGAWTSSDRGRSWTSLNTNLPTVAVHAFALHPTAGEIVAATHGRSLWAMDVTTLRQVTKETLAAPAHLYKPAVAIQWRPQPGRGRTRSFVGENPPTGATIHYSLAAPGKGTTAKLEIRAQDGKTLRTLEAGAEAGLHAVRWDLRRAPAKGRRVGGRVGPGTYVAVLTVGEAVFEQDVVVAMDPAHEDPVWLAHEDAAEEAEAARRAAKARRHLPRDEGRDE